MYMSKLHTFLLLRRAVTVSATDLRGAVSPKPGAADYVPPCKETYVQKVVEPGLITTEVKYPLLRACSSSAALTAAGLHTHVRTHRTSSDPAYLHTYVHLYMREGKEGCCYFRNPGLKRTFGLTVTNGFTKTVTLHLRSIGPNVQRHMAYFADTSLVKYRLTEEKDMWVY
jgi:hypothetical protein